MANKRINQLTAASAATGTMQLAEEDSAGGNLTRKVTVSQLSTFLWNSPTLVTPNVGNVAAGVWGGTNIALNKGGTNASLTAVNGGLFYSTASAGAILAPGTPGQILTMSGGVPVWATDSGTGTVTSVAATSSDLTIGGSPITAAGTLTFSLNTVAINKGGTGQTSAAAAFNALSPLTTTGDIIYASGANTAATLPIGTSGQVLTVSGGLPVWTTGGESDVNSITGTANQIAASSPAGDVTLSLTGPYTPATYTAHGVLLGEGTSSIVAVAPSATVGMALVSGGASADPSYGTVVVAGGGTGVTSVTTAPTATAFAGWDANGNLSADSFIAGYETTVTAAATTTLTVSSLQQQFFTGSTTQTVVLPVTSTMVLGQSFTIVNNSSGVVTVNASDSSLVQAMAAGSSLIVTVISIIGTTNAAWSKNYSSSVDAGGTVTSVAASVPGFLSISGSPVTTAGTLAISYSGTALPVANGGTAVTSVTTAPTASSFAGWDANSNLSADNFISGYATTPTAAGTTTLTVNSLQQQYFTGSTTQTVVLPVTSTMVLGQSFTIVNSSSGVVTVNASDSSLVQTMSANSRLIVTVISVIGTTNAAWSTAYSSSVDAGGTVTSVALSSASNTLTIGGSPITSAGTLTANLTGGYYNSGTPYNMGWGTTQSFSSGSGNTFLGWDSLVSTSSGVGNTAMGWRALYTNIGGSGNTAIGYGALISASAPANNTCVGLDTGSSLVTGINNSLFGAAAGTTLAGSNVSAFGNNALEYATGSNLCAFGANALQYNTAAQNSAFGFNSLTGALGTSTGGLNSAFGYSTLVALTTGASNTVMGNNSGAAITTGSSNCLFGDSTGILLTTNSNLCSFGAGALQYATGANNNAFGFNALQGVNGSSTGTSNNAFGSNVLDANTTGSGNTGMGDQVLVLNTTGSSNTAVGNLAGTAITTGGTNSLFGVSAGSLISTTSTISAFGYQAMQNTVGIQSCAFGYQALQGNAVPATAYDNNAFGYQALANVTTAFANTAVGVLAQNGNTTGYSNVALGNFALSNASAPLNNTIIGAYSGTTYTTTESGNIILGANCGGVQGESYVTRIGFGTDSGGPNQGACFIDGIVGVSQGTPINAVTINAAGQLGVGVVSRTSEKENIRDMPEASSGIMELKFKGFNYIKDEHKTLQLGFMLEDALDLVPTTITRDKAGNPIGFDYMLMVPLMINEMQKLKDRIVVLESRLSSNAKKVTK